MEFNYPKMRRKDRLASDEKTQDILKNAEYGVLSLPSDATGVYGVPLSFVLDGNALYFHSARTGHKIDAIKDGAPASFCTVLSSQPVYEGDFSTFFKSAIAFGTVRLVEDTAEQARALCLLCEKYLPDYMEHADASIRKSQKVTAIIKLDISHVTGKAKE